MNTDLRAEIDAIIAEKPSKAKKRGSRSSVTRIDVLELQHEDLLQRLDELPTLLSLKHHVGTLTAHTQRMVIEKGTLGQEIARLKGELRTRNAYVGELERLLDEAAERLLQRGMAGK